MKLFELNKKIIITSLFILLCLVGYVFFPATGYFQYKAAAVIFLVLLPFLYNKYFLKGENLFKKIIIGDWKNNLKWLTIGLTLSFLIMAAIFKFTDLGEHYFLSSGVKGNFWKFLSYELTGVLLTVVMYELFFRGFVQTYFSKLYGKWAILIQFIFFVAMTLLLFGLPYWFYITYLVFALFAGWIAYKSNSLLYSFAGQLLFVIIVDTAYIALTVTR